MCPLSNFHFKPQGGTREAFASPPEIRPLLHCAEILVRQRETIELGPARSRERKLTSAHHSWAQGRVRLCSGRAAVSGARERMCRSMNALRVEGKRHFEGLGPPSPAVVRGGGHASRIPLPDRSFPGSKAKRSHPSGGDPGREILRTFALGLGHRGESVGCL